MTFAYDTFMIYVYIYIYFYIYIYSSLSIYICMYILYAYVSYVYTYIYIEVTEKTLMNSTFCTLCTELCIYYEDYCFRYHYYYGCYYC